MLIKDILVNSLLNCYNLIREMKEKIQELLDFAIAGGYNNDALGEITREFYQMCEPYLEEYDDEIIYEAYQRVLENSFKKSKEYEEENIYDIKELASNAIKNVKDIYFNDDIEIEYDEPYTR